MDDGPETTEVTDDAQADAAAEADTGSSRRRQAVLVTGTAIVLAVGVLLGYVLAHTASQGGLSGALGAMFLTFVLAVGIGLTAVFGLIAAAFRRSRRIGTGALAVAGILVLGILAGFALTPVLGLEYRAPVTLEARGTASARLDGGVAFTPLEPGYATCWSEPGSDTMANMELDLGRLGAGLLRGSVSISEAGSTEAWVELRADSPDDAEGAFQPEWLGTSEVTELSERGSSGRVSFRELRRGTDTGPRDDATNDTWPSALSGSLSWACEAPLDPFATAPPTRSGRIELRLDGVDWSQPPSRANATCHSERGSSVEYVIGNDIGLLQGSPVEVRLSSLSDSGGLLLSIRLTGKDPPPGQPYFPNWDGRLRYERDDAGNASGHAGFSDLLTGVAPGVKPLEGWPLSLTGSVDWSCGEDDPAVGLVGDDR